MSGNLLKSCLCGPFGHFLAAASAEPLAGGVGKAERLQLGQGWGLKALLSLGNWDQTCQHPRFPSQKVGARQRFAKVLIYTCLSIAQCVKNNNNKINKSVPVSSWT